MGTPDENPTSTESSEEERLTRVMAGLPNEVLMGLDDIARRTGVKRGPLLRAAVTLFVDRFRLYLESRDLFDAYRTAFQGLTGGDYTSPGYVVETPNASFEFNDADASDAARVQRKADLVARIEAGETVDKAEALDVGLIPVSEDSGTVTLSTGEKISKAQLHEGQDDAAYYAGLTEAVGLATRARKAQEAVDALGAGKPIDPSDDPKGVALDARTGEPIKRHYHRIADQKRASAHRTWFDKGVEYGEFACACGQTVTRTVKE